MAVCPGRAAACCLPGSSRVVRARSRLGVKGPRSGYIYPLSPRQRMVGEATDPGGSASPFPLVVVLVLGAACVRRSGLSLVMLGLVAVRPWVGWERGPYGCAGILGC